MKEIELTQGKVAIVDDDMFEYLNQWKWYFNGRYAVRNAPMILRKRLPQIRMHREILETLEDMETDHINGDDLDNRKINLRICNHSQNQANRGKTIKNTSGHKGIGWSKFHKKWRSQIGVKGIHKHLGYFIDIEDAIRIHEKASLEYFGEFAKV